VVDLRGGAGATHDPGGAAQSRDLSGEAADRAGGAGDEHRVALLQFADLDKPGVRGQARHTQHTEVRRPWREVRIDPADLVRGGDGVLAPSQAVQHSVAGGEVRGVRGDDDAHRAALERCTHLERRDVGLDVVHPASHVRVDRHELVADQHLAIARLGHVGLDEAEVRGYRPAGRSRCEADLTAGAGAHAGWCPSGTGRA
jgi:hypothetical protein